MVTTDLKNKTPTLEEKIRDLVIRQYINNYARKSLNKTWTINLNNIFHKLRSEDQISFKIIYDALTSKTFEEEANVKIIGLKGTPESSNTSIIFEINYTFQDVILGGLLQLRNGGWPPLLCLSFGTLYFRHGTLFLQDYFYFIFLIPLMILISTLFSFLLYFYIKKIKTDYQNFCIFVGYMSLFFSNIFFLFPQTGIEGLLFILFLIFVFLVPTPQSSVIISIFSSLKLIFLKRNGKKATTNLSLLKGYVGLLGILLIYFPSIILGLSKLYPFSGFFIISIAIPLYFLFQWRMKVKENKRDINYNSWIIYIEILHFILFGILLIILIMIFALPYW